MNKVMDRSKYPQYREHIEKARNTVKATHTAVETRRKEVNERMVEQHRHRMMALLSYFRRMVHI